MCCVFLDSNSINAPTASIETWWLRVEKMDNTSKKRNKCCCYSTVFLKLAKRLWTLQGQETTHFSWTYSHSLSLSGSDSATQKSTATPVNVSVTQKSTTTTVNTSATQKSATTARKVFLLLGNLLFLVMFQNSVPLLYVFWTYYYYCYYCEYFCYSEICNYYS